MRKRQCWARYAFLACGAAAATLVIVLLLFGGFWLLASPSDLKNPDSGEPYLDMHVHVAGLGYGESGAFVGDSILNSYKLSYYLQGFGVTEEELARHGDALVLERLSGRLAASREVSRAIVLALDGIVDEKGRLDRSRTQVYVPNAFLAAELTKYPNLLFGASVNPHRNDAIERLHQVAEQGAILVKWIPNIMEIDPSAERHRDFYAALRDLGLPLLTHTGMERSFATANDQLGDPRRLEFPLSMGVVVIAAHIATTGSTDHEEHFERILGMFADHPNLYADISSLTQFNKIGYLKRALEAPEIVERLVFGTDWPLQFFPVVSPLYHLGYISIADAKSVSRTSNSWDRDVYLKRAIGVPEEVFVRGPKLLEKTRLSAVNR